MFVHPFTGRLFVLASCCGILLSHSCFSIQGAEPVSGFKPIFNGQDLTGWSGAENFWSVQEGVITGESTAENPCEQNTFLRWTDGEVDNFELKLKFRISGSPQANSGIQFRSQVQADGHVVGYQADIDLAGKWLGACYDERGRGLLAGRGQTTTVSEPAAIQRDQTGDAEKLMQAVNLSDWNEYHITANGNQLTLKINGLLMSQVTDNDTKNRDFSGVLALQLHSGPPMKIEFKDLQLKRLPLENHKKIVFIAGSKSHGYFSHEHNAGCLLLAESLNQSGLPVITTVYQNGWPRDVTAFDNADTVICYCDGGGRHILNPHLEEFDQVMSRGVGLVCIHYAVETVIGPEGDHFLKWMGGYFEPNWSVNPHWVAEFKNLPDHPVTRGVKPFSINDEWYYHMRFAKGMEGVTPILTDMPDRQTLTRPDGPHSGNPFVREAVLVRKEPQHVGWAFERAGQGRGFGFTGGHWHVNWQNDQFRKVVLNAIAWTAHMEVPETGVDSPTPDPATLQKNQDYPQPENWKFQPPVTEKPQTAAVEESKDKTLTAQTVSATTSQSRELKDATTQLTVTEGLKVELFAGEPLMHNPTNIDIDALGRVWVCEVVNYRQFRNTDSPERTAGDRILILEDKNKDGQADKVKVFYQGRDVDSAHGICVLGNRILISAGDSVFWLIDENNDDKADKKELLFTGIEGTQHDHGIHAAVFGPDGKLYFNFGNAGKKICDANGNPIVDKQGNIVNDSRKPYQEGMVFRCNLDGSEFETLGWNFRNNWEVCVDSFGTMWQSDNDDDGNRGVRINYVMEYGNYGYRDELTGAGWRESRSNLETEVPLQHWHQNDPGVIPNLLQTGAGSPTGILFYEGDLLPEVFRNQIIHCDAGPNIVRAYPVGTAGAGYTASVVNLLEGIADQWFRPSDACVAPDGSLFVADWYDPGVGGHRMADIDRGRIFRLAPPGIPYQVSRPKLDSVEGAIQALLSPNLASRYLGWTKLHEMGETAVPSLVRLWETGLPRMQARALWLLGKMNLPRDQKLNLLISALTHENADLRITGLRLARQLTSEFTPEDYAHAIRLDDDSPAVRREILIGLREVDLPEMPRYWAELAAQHNGQDRWYLEALGISADNNWDACLSAWLELVGTHWNTPAGRDIIWRSRSSQTAEYLTDMVRDPKTPVAELPRYFRAFDFVKPVDQKLLAGLAFDDDISQLPGANLITTEAVSRLADFKIQDFPEYTQALQNILTKQRGTPVFVAMVKQFGMTDEYPSLLELAINFSDQQLGVDAITVLLDAQQQPLIQAGLLNNQTESAVKLAQVLGLSENNQITGPLILVVRNNKADIEVRRAAVRALSRTRPGIARLADMAVEDKVAAGLKPTVAAVMYASVYRDVQEKAEKVFPLPPTKNAKPLPPISELAERTGDLKNGRFVFHNHGTCAKCHQVNGLGKEVGPDLSEIGKKLSRQAMLESILYPSAGISHNYETYTVVTIDGNLVSGLLVSQSDQEISLKNAEGIVKTVDADDVEEMIKQEVSLMPADLQKEMSEQDLIDVVEYMLTLKEKK